MAGFDPRQALHDAQSAESSGKSKRASGLYSRLAVYLRQKGKLAESRKLSLRAIALLPTSARLYVQLALTDALLGDTTAASDAVERFARCAISQGRYRAYRSYFDTTLKDHPGLRQIFYQRLVEIDRTDGQLFAELARLCLAQEHFDQALYYALKAVMAKSGLDEAYSLVEQALSSAGRVDDLRLLEQVHLGRISLDDFVEALTPNDGGLVGQKPSDAEPRADLDERGLSSMIRDLEREIGVTDNTPDTVSPLVREFRQRAGIVLDSDTKLRIDLALAFHEMGLSSDGLEELQCIDRADPYYVQAQAAVGDILVAQGSDLGALEAFQNCVRDERVGADGCKDAYYKMAQIYTRLGDLRRAERQVEALEAIDSNYRGLRALKQLIERALRLR